VHLFRFLVELFSFGFDVLCPCQSSIEKHAQIFHFIFAGVVKKYPPVYCKHQQFYKPEI
jgi:hypothetical protein